MRQAYIISQGLEKFAAAREQFGLLLSTPQSEAALQMQHAKLEEVISQEGTELLRRLLAGHLDLRSAREPRVEQVTGTDGADRGQCRQHCERTMTTLFVEVKLNRVGYGPR